MPAFHSALEQGFSCVETDVARTRDGYLVAVHVRELRELSADPAAQVSPLQARSMCAESRDYAMVECCLGLLSLCLELFGNADIRILSQPLLCFSMVTYRPLTGSVQAADFTWTEMQALQEPAGHDSHIPLLADVVQLLQSAVPNITLDVKLKVVTCLMHACQRPCLLVPICKNGQTPSRRHAKDTSESNFMHFLKKGACSLANTSKPPVHRHSMQQLRVCLPAWDSASGGRWKGCGHRGDGPCSGGPHQGN